MVDYQVMPPLSNEEYEQLKADIQERGVQVPVEYDDAGNILDGHHRVQICKELGIKDWPKVVRVGLTEEQKRAHARKLNLVRRHLNQEQKRELIRQQLAETPQKSDNLLASTLGVTDKTVRVVREEMEAGSEIPKLDHLVGADGKAYPRQVERKTPPLEEPFVPALQPIPPYPQPLQKPAAIFMPSGSVEKTVQKVAEVVQAAQEDPDKFASLVERMARTGKVGGTHKLMQRMQQAEEITREAPPLPEGPFRVIVVDPPWDYSARADDPTHRASNPYPSMSIEEIKAMPVSNIAHEDAILWLWTTNAHMRYAYEIADAWGFEPKTILTWVKDRMGTGDWLRGQTEHCIMAVRGKPVVMLTNQTTAIHGPLREHSRKPDEFYALVEALCPGSKVELFCRTPRRGWATHGDQVGLFSSEVGAGA